MFRTFYLFSKVSNRVEQNVNEEVGKSIMEKGKHAIKHRGWYPTVDEHQFVKSVENPGFFQIPEPKPKQTWILLIQSKTVVT